MRVNLPVYQYNPQTIKIEIERFLNDKQILIDHLSNQKIFDYENLINPIQNIFAEFQEQFFNPINITHTLASNETSNELHRFAQDKAIELDKLFFNNDKLYKAICQLEKNNTFKKLSDAQKKTVENLLESFRDNGIHLSAAKRNQLIKIKKELSKLTDQFQTLNDKEADCHRLLIENEDLLTHLPKTLLDEGKANAKKEKKSGILLQTSQLFPNIKFITYAPLREKIYKEFLGLKYSDSKNGPYRDKTDLIEAIMQNRLALAKLLGFKNYAEYCLDNKAFKDPVEIISFLVEAYKKMEPHQKQEMDRLSDFAKYHLNLVKLNPWDFAFAEYEFEKHFMQNSENSHVLHFGEKEVWQHLEYTLHKLYNLRLTPFNTETWHPDVQCYKVTDNSDQLVGLLYFDLYVRPNKRSTGAWTNPIISRRRLENNDSQAPIAIVSCNFTPPSSDGNIIYHRDQITTLFHETGHALQHILTTIDNYLVSGFRGVSWDTIEVPSLFFEHWADKGSLSKLAPPLLPAQHVVNAARHFLQDITLHFEYQGTGIYQTLEAISHFLNIPLCNRMDSNTHVFGSGGSAYGSCEYTYLLSQSIAALLFAPFKEFGVFDTELGKRFKETFLQQGGSKDPLEMFGDFLGIDPHTFEAKHKQQRRQRNANTSIENISAPKNSATSQNKMILFAEKISGQRRTREQSTKETTAQPGL